ncbi:peptidase family C78-domain-containing protein [Mycena rebaudengoi]|nr:peptidase family C78-domain-containing protein [Mycena rebaudengoi]
MSYTLSGGRIGAAAPSKPSKLECQLCSANLGNLPLTQREEHYEKHFSDAEPLQASVTRADDLHNSRASASSSTPPAPRPSGFSRFGFKKLGHQKVQDLFWYPAQTSKPPPNYTPGLIPLIRQHLNRSHAKGNTRRAVLCYDRAVLVTREGWDTSWGCGYRNFLMACTALMDQPFQPMYFPLLDDPIPPSVRNLQKCLEDAWTAGYDPEGAQQLKKKLVGTKKWIGTGDLHVAFTFRGIPSKLVDFDLKKNPRGADILTDWVIEYFSQSNDSTTTRTVNNVLLGASVVTITSHMPLILQHDGHSRTIVGYEVSKTGAINLLVFDPSRIPSKNIRRAAMDIFLSKSGHHTPPVAATSTNPVASSSGKRRASSDGNAAPLKRACSENREVRRDEEDDEVQIVHDSRDKNLRGGDENQKSPVHGKKQDNKGDSMSASEFLKNFRLDPKKLEKKNAYQILYFPMTKPLSDVQKRRGKPIFSEQIC